MRTRLKSALPWGVLAVAMVLPIALVLGLGFFLRDDTADLLTPEQQVWLDVERTESSDEVEVLLTLEWGPGAQLVAPNWYGVVTATALAAGELKSGHRVVALDGRWRLAAHTAAPFHRSLTVGDRGEDVASLNAFLAASGFGALSGDRYSWATSEAVLAMEQQLGGDSDRHFDPSDLIWLPAESFDIVKSLVVVGKPAPGAGEPLAEGPPIPISAKVSGNGQMPTAVEGSELVVEVEGEALVYSGNPSAPLADVSALTAVVPSGTPQISVTISNQASVESWSVPVAAVFETDRGTCLVYRVDDESPHLAAAVSVVGGTIGETSVTSPDLPRRFEVLSNPEATTCD